MQFLAGNHETFNTQSRNRQCANDVVWDTLYTCQTKNQMTTAIIIQVETKKSTQINTWLKWFNV
jgi:hypothetical protein